jgi:Uma2 family endonuclease
MAAILTTPLPAAQTNPDEERAPRKRWTREDCDFLERVGLLEERYELLDGEIILKVGQNQPHAMAVTRLFAWLLGVFGVARVQTQTTIEIAGDDRPMNRPEPDAFVLARPDYEINATPDGGSDIVLVAEVADATLRDDLQTKAGLYARAGVPEYWVVDVSARRLFVHRAPAEGRYAEVVAYAEAETVATLAAPDNPVRIADLLPPLPASGK